MRFNKFHIFILLTLTGYIALEYYRPRPVDWTATYSNRDKIPYGTRALYELLPGTFPGTTVTTERQPLYNTLEDSEMPGKSNYVSINEHFEIDNYDLKVLFDYVDAGNMAFISAYHFPDTLLNRLSLTLENNPSARTPESIRFENKALSGKMNYLFPYAGNGSFFRTRDAKNITLLGTNEFKQPVHVKVSFGKGYFFLHCMPIAFTNYYVLAPNTSAYAFEALSYLPVAPTLWDEYLKQGRFDADNQSILRYIAREPALRAAWYLALISLLAYIIFAGKRKQRIIPVLTPPQNASLDFIKMIGNMYYLKKAHISAARKRIQYFNMYVWEKLGIRPEVYQKPELVLLLTSKSGLPQQEIQDLVAEIEYVQNVDHISKNELISLNSKIEAFYRVAGQ